MSIKIKQCACGSEFAPVFWSSKKETYICKLCAGYPREPEKYYIDKEGRVLL